MNSDRRTFLRSVRASAGAAGVLDGAGKVAAAGTYTNHYYSGFDYWKYVPDSTGANAPLVVMLHGCSQDADQFRAETQMNGVADREGFVVIYPDQYNARNGAQCWNWFYDSNTTRGNGGAAVIAGMTRETVSAESVDPRHVYIAGLSAGGAMVPNLLAEYADVYAAGGVHSGLEYDATDTASGGTAAMSYGRPDIREGYRRLRRDGVLQHHESAPDHRFSRDGRRHGRADKRRPSDDTGRPDERRRCGYDGRQHDRRRSASFDYTVSEYHDQSGDSLVEYWQIEGMGHPWSGGAAGGEYTAPGGPDASRIMWDFFAQHTRSG